MGVLSVDGLNPTPVALLCLLDWRPVFAFLVLLLNIRMVDSSYFGTS